MNNKIFKTKQKNYFMKELQYFDGEEYITFNILEANFNKATIVVAITNRGKIYNQEFDLLKDTNGWYFEYGYDFEKIYIEDFE